MRKEASIGAQLTPLVGNIKFKMKLIIISLKPWTDFLS